MSLLLNSIASGLAIGAVYGLVALGYTVVFNATRIFNLAQGDLVMLGVLLSYFLLDVAHWPQLPTLLAVVVGVPLVALFEERVVVRPFLKRPADNIGWFIATLAFSLVVETVVTILYGDNPPMAVPSPVPSTTVRFLGITIAPKLILAFGALVVVAVLLEIFYKRTWLGTAMRATAHDREVAALRGISPAKISALAFLIAGVTGAVAGYVVAPIVFSDVSIGLTYSLQGFVALAIGGFGSIRGALVGAFILGIGEQVWDQYFDPRYEIVAALILLMVVLAVRPTGIFGERNVRTV